MLHLSLRRFEVFVAVADEGSLSAAAARLGISQPSVSEHIRALERNVGERLLERRRGHAARLTPTGRTLATRARKLMAQVLELTADMGADQDQRRRHMVIAAQRRISTSILPQLLADFARDHPEVELVLKSGSMEEVVGMLRNGAADLGYFLSNEPVDDLPCTVVAHEPFIFIAAPNHPLAGRKRIAPHELAAYRFIRGAKGSLLGQAVDGLLAGIGLGNIEVASRSTDDRVIHRFVADGLGISFSMAKSVAPELRQGTVKQLAVVAPPLTLDVWQALPVRAAHTVTTRQFCQHVESHWPR